jgi:MFS family permease
MPKSTALAGVLVGSALHLVLIPYFGHRSDQRGRRPVYVAGAVVRRSRHSCPSRCWTLKSLSW